LHVGQFGRVEWKLRVPGDHPLQTAAALGELLELERNSFSFCFWHPESVALMAEP